MNGKTIAALYGLSTLIENCEVDITHLSIRHINDGKFVASVGVNLAAFRYLVPAERVVVEPTDNDAHAFMYAYIPLPWNDEQMEVYCVPRIADLNANEYGKYLDARVKEAEEKCEEIIRQSE